MQEGKRFWSQKARNIEPYVAGEQPRDSGIIKLNTNENPYGPGPKVKAVLNAYDADQLRLYPDPTCHRLKTALSGYYGVGQEGLFIGNGSDEILALAFLAFFDSDQRPVRFPDISYSFYPVYAGLFEVPHETFPLQQDFSIDPGRLPSGGRALILANPNAPTGMALSAAGIEAVLSEDRNRLVIVDEAYVDFGAQSAVSLLPAYDNLLIIQTLSKSRALAGMRIGFALGHPDLIEALERIRDSFNSYTVDRIAQEVAVAAIDSGAWFEQTRRQVITTREKTAEALRHLGFEMTKSQANFLFIRHERRQAKQIHAGLRKKGVLVRHFERERIDNHLRVSIGTEAEMEAFLTKIAEVIHKGES